MILGVESSCDESALALLDPSGGLIGEWVSSQVSLHAQYGGVVPDLASREHLENFGPLLKAAFPPGLGAVREIAVTAGPGLAGCLAMGVTLARALSVAADTPVYPVNHLRAHAHSVFLQMWEENPASFEERLGKFFPHLALVVSGGNTLLARMESPERIEILGQTIDDAAGEALDKGAKLLGLGYPGGPKLESTALSGQPDAFDFPRGLAQKATLDFSFSGLKTSLRYRLEKMSPNEISSRLPDLCASYQEAVVDVLARKCERALRLTACRSLGLSGGVSNNRSLRQRLKTLAEECGILALMAVPQHTGDNAAMIAFSHFLEGGHSTSHAFGIDPSATLEQRL